MQTTLDTGSLLFINEFPDSIGRSFDLNAYNKQFSDRSFIIHASGQQMEYAKHWGVLSIKCAFQGVEYYEAGNGFYAVDDSNFLIFNEGTYRSSHISSKNRVESFSISFSPRMVRSFLASIISARDAIREDPFYVGDEYMYFTEKLYSHNDLISPLLLKIKALSGDWVSNHQTVEEMISFLLDAMVMNQRQVWIQMRNVKGVKISTQKELYERLNRARDYIYSCYKNDLTTEAIANVACLNQHYFLREFKREFKCTPHQYLQLLRLKEAKRLLETTDKLVTEICNEIGYSDLGSFSKLYKKHFHHAPSMGREGRLPIQINQLASGKAENDCCAEEAGASFQPLILQHSLKL